MWGLSNHTRYAAERTWVRDKSGHHHWVVAVKGTFDVALDGELHLASEQSPPLMVPEYFGEPGLSSLRLDSDLVPGKVATEVIVNAYAHAPHGEPATSVLVGLRVGSVEKTLVVHGPRRYVNGGRGLATTDEQPFLRCAIRYEDAYGGSDLSDPDPRKQRLDPRNPIGKGVKAGRADVFDVPAHRIEYPQGDYSKVGPAGFGALASHWSPRLELAGTYDEAWFEQTRPLLPVDYDERFTLCAPIDQRASAYLTGGEPVRLVNMTAEGVLRTTLPRVELVHTTRIKGRHLQHRSKLVTVVLEPERRCLMLVWHTSVPVAATLVDHLIESIVEEQAAP